MKWTSSPAWCGADGRGVPWLVAVVVAMTGVIVGVQPVEAGPPVGVTDSYRIGRPADGATNPPALRTTAFTGVLANDTHPTPGTILTATLVTGPTRGTLQFNSDGSFVYTPGPDFATWSDSFTYRASDGESESAVTTVNLQYMNNSLLYTSDIIRLEVTATGSSSGAIDVYVAGKNRSGVQSFVRQYYAPLGTVVWFEGNTRFRTNYFDGTTPTFVSSRLIELKNAEDEVVGGRIETVHTLGATGVELKQTFTVRDGDRFITKAWTLTNNGVSTSAAIRLFHGGDTYFGDDDSARGYFDPANTMVYLRNLDFENWGLMGFYANPGTPATRYVEGHYFSVVRAQVNATTPQLGNTVDPNFIDAGYALQWNRAGLAPGEIWTVEAFEVWTEGGAFQVLAPASQNVAPDTVITLPFTVQNLTASPATYGLAAASTRAEWSVSLPDGGSVTVPGGGSVTVNVAVSVPAGAEAGDTSSVSLTASAGGVSRIGSSTLTTVIVPLELDINSIDFTVVLTVVPGAPQLVTIRNTGSGNISFGTLAILAPFAVGNDTCSGETVAPDATCTAEVSFNPTQPGSFSANLNIPVVAPELVTRTIPVQGAYVDGIVGAVDDQATANAGRPLTVNAPGVKANDVEDSVGDLAAATVALVSGPSHGLVTLNADGSFTYVSDPTFTGLDVFSYKLVNPDASESNVARVRVTVNEDPITLDEPFTDPDPGNSCWVFLGSAYMTAAGADPLDPQGEGWLRLTDAIPAQAGSAIYNCAIDSADGFVATFDYATYGGSGADGFTFYLIDGATATPTVGTAGGSLGYSRGESGGGPSPGVTNGYVGVAFDEYGNFTQATSGPCAAPAYPGGVCPTSTSNVLAVRGAGSLLDGFPLLTHVRGSSLSPARAVATGSRENSRPVKISVFNNRFSLQVDFGAGYQTVIDDFNLGEGGAGQTLPATLKFGFSGSTGAATNVHEIRRLVVSRPATVTVTNTDGATEKSAGESTTYTVTVTNGTENDVYFADFTNQIPSDILGVSWTCAGEGGGVCVTPAGTGNAVQTVVHLPKGASVSFTITGTVRSPLGGGIVLSSVATLTTPAGITNLALNSATDTTTVANVAPVAVADSYLTPEDTPLVVAAPGVLTNDTDANADALTAVLVTGPVHGVLTLNPNGSFTYTPAANYHGPDSFTYRASDGTLTSAVTTVSLTVTPVEDAPVGAADSYVVRKNTPLAIDAPGVLANDTDIEGDGLVAAWVSGPAHGDLDFHADGRFTYTPEAGYVGLDSFVYRPVNAGVGGAAGADTTVSLDVQQFEETLHFAEGFEGGGIFSSYVLLGNFGDEAAEVTMTAYDNGATLATRSLTVPAGRRVTVPMATFADGAPVEGEFALSVEALPTVGATRTMMGAGGAWMGGGATQERAVPASTTWYFAEGATGDGFDLYYLLANPSDTEADVTVTYFVEGGAPVVLPYTVAPRDRLTVHVDLEDPALAAAGVSTAIASTVPIVVERAMYLVDPVGPSYWPGGHAGAGAPAPAETWYFAEGVNLPIGFQTFLLLANPSATELAEVEVTYARELGEALIRTYTVAPQARFTVQVATEAPELAQAAFGMVVRSTNGVPVVAERAVWWARPTVGPSATPYSWREGHASAGVTAPGLRWGFAEGVLGGALDASGYLLVMNPGDEAGAVRVTLLFEDGRAPVSATYPVAGQQRLSLELRAEFPEADGTTFSVLVESVGETPVPMVVEQSVYWADALGAWAAGVNTPAQALPDVR